MRDYEQHGIRPQRIWLCTNALRLRFLAATNRQHEEAIKQAKLREDLYYRLKVFQLSLHTLRDRAEDVPLLAEHFLTQIAAFLATLDHSGGSKRKIAKTLGLSLKTLHNRIRKCRAQN